MTRRGALWAVVLAALAAGLGGLGGGARAASSALALLVALQLGLAALDGALGFGGRAACIARVHVREAVRVRVAVALLAVLVLGVPLLPGALSSDQPLLDRARLVVQVGLGATFAIASLLAIFATCGCIGEDLRAQRIALVATKPIGRGTYLVGHALGASLLVAVVLAASGAAVAWTAWSEARAAPDPEREMVRSEVFAARRSAPLGPPPEARAALRAEVERAAREAAAADGTLDLQEAMDDEALRRVAAYHAIAPRSRRVFAAEGLGDAEGALTLLYTLRSAALDAPAGREVPLVITIDPGGAHEAHHPVRAGLDAPGRLPVDPAAIGPDGRLVIALTQGSAGTVSVPPGDDLRVMVTVSGFAANLARGLTVLWGRLLLVVGISILLASCTSFPVATLGSGVAFLGLLAGGFVRAAVLHLEAQEGGPLAGALAAVTAPLGRYADLGPVERLASGLLVPWSDAIEAVAGVGLGGGGLCLLVAWGIFRRRELAEVQA